MNLYVSKSLLTTLFKGGILLLTATAVMVAARFLEIESLQDAAWVDTHLRRGTRGILVFLTITAVSSAIGLPRQALAFLGGYAFGAFYGTLWSSIGLTAGCACGFFYSRMLGQNMLHRRLGDKIRLIDSFLCSSPFLTAISIRFFPVGNNALTNMAAGVTAIPAMPFIAGSAVGYLPQTLVFVLLGSGIQLGAELQIVLSSVLFVATSLFGLRLFRKFKADRGKTRETPEK